MPKVYVTQEVGKLDYASAKKFGELVFVTVMDFSPEANSINNKVLVDEIRRKLENYNPKEDCIVISGSPTVSAAVFMIVREKTETVRVLKWSNRDLVYREVKINLR